MFKQLLTINLQSRQELERFTNKAMKYDSICGLETTILKQANHESFCYMFHIIKKQPLTADLEHISHLNYLQDERWVRVPC